MKVNKYVLIGLAVVVLATLYFVFGSGGKKKVAASVTAPPPAPPRIGAPVADVREKGERVQAVQETMKWERDPFALPSFLLAEKKKDEKQRVPLKLFAIMEGSGRRVAVIDNQVVGRGDVVAGERVVEIGKETVTLVQDGSKRVIALQEPR